MKYALELSEEVVRAISYGVLRSVSSRGCVPATATLSLLGALARNDQSCKSEEAAPISISSSSPSNSSTRSVSRFSSSDRASVVPSRPSPRSRLSIERIGRIAPVAMINVPAAQQLRFARKGPPKKAAPPKKPVDNLVKDQNKRAANRPPWIPSFSSAFRLIILVRFFAAMYTSLADCDEGESPRSAL